MDFNFNGSAKLLTYVDADFGGDLQERKSTSGYVCFLG